MKKYVKLYKDCHIFKSSYGFSSWYSANVKGSVLYGVDCSLEEFEKQIDKRLDDLILIGSVMSISKKI